MHSGGSSGGEIASILKACNTNRDKVHLLIIKIDVIALFQIRKKKYPFES